MTKGTRVKWLWVADDTDHSGTLIRRLEVYDLSREKTGEYAWRISGDDGQEYIVEEEILQPL